MTREKNAHKGLNIPYAAMVVVERGRWMYAGRQILLFGEKAAKVIGPDFLIARATRPEKAN